MWAPACCRLPGRQRPRARAAVAGDVAALGGRALHLQAAHVIDAGTGLTLDTLAARLAEVAARRYDTDGDRDHVGVELGDHEILDTVAADIPGRQTAR